MHGQMVVSGHSAAKAQVFDGDRYAHAHSCPLGHINYIAFDCFGCHSVICSRQTTCNLSDTLSDSLRLQRMCEGVFECTPTSVARLAIAARCEKQISCLLLIAFTSDIYSSTDIHICIHDAIVDKHKRMLGNLSQIVDSCGHCTKQCNSGTCYNPYHVVLLQRI